MNPRFYEAVVVNGHDPETVDGYIDEWHAGAGGGDSLEHYMGLTFEEYSLFVQDVEKFNQWLIEERQRYKETKDYSIFMLERLLKITEEMTPKEYKELYYKAKKLHQKAKKLKKINAIKEAFAKDFCEDENKQKRKKPSSKIIPEPVADVEGLCVHFTQASDRKIEAENMLVQTKSDLISTLKAFSSEHSASANDLMNLLMTVPSFIESNDEDSGAEFLKLIEKLLKKEEDWFLKNKDSGAARRIPKVFIDAVFCLIEKMFEDWNNAKDIPVNAWCYCFRAVLAYHKGAQVDAGDCVI